MDWELYQRFRATLLLAAVILISFLLLLFQRTSVVRHFRTFLAATTLPTERFLSSLKTPPQTLPSPAGSTAAANPETAAPPSWGVEPERRRAVQVLNEENKRLRDLLDLRDRRWPQAIAAHVVGRDPQRWFQEIVIDKGRLESVAVDDPVIAVVEGREGLVGRVSETADHIAKVMLIQDPLSAVPATALGAGAEDGVVEGSNSHDLILRYLPRSSRIKLGDPVVTSGLGKAFPEGIPLGWVEDIRLDPRQLFLQARLRSAVQANRLQVVLILARPQGGPAERTAE